MARPDMFIVYVSSVAATVDFYRRLFEIEPAFFPSPGFASFELAGGVQLALWSSHGEDLGESPRRTSEVCLCLAGGPEQIDEHYRVWTDLGVAVVEEPHDEIFGRTFVIADPDQNRIRVAPVD